MQLRLAGGIAKAQAGDKLGGKITRLGMDQRAEPRAIRADSICRVAPRWDARRMTTSGQTLPSNRRSANDRFSGDEQKLVGKVMPFR
jgi:hypothetical protein